MAACALSSSAGSVAGWSLVVSVAAASGLETGAAVRLLHKTASPMATSSNRVKIPEVIKAFGLDI
jgi:hypothetical protein